MARMATLIKGGTVVSSTGADPADVVIYDPQHRWTIGRAGVGQYLPRGLCQYLQ